MRKYTKFYIQIVFLFIFVSLFSCTKKEPPPTPPPLIPELTEIPAPRDLKVQPRDRIAFMEWAIDGEIDAYVLGYNVYADTFSLVNLLPQELPTPLGTWPPMYVESDTVNDWSQYILQNLDPGKKYYVHLRIKGTNGRLSAPSNEVSIITRPEGDIRLYETSAPNFSAFDFSALELVSSTSQDADIYFDYAAQPRLKSPHLRNSGSRHTKFMVLPDGVLPATIEESDFSSSVVISEGITILAKTEDGNFAKIIVKELNGNTDYWFIELKYYYQAFRNLLQF